MTRLHKLLLSTAALGVVLSAAPTLALAQAQATAAEDTGTVDEIVVTARKRAETLLEVPLAVTVLSGTQLEQAGIRNTNDLYGRVPGLYFTNAGGAAPTSDFVYLAFRGVGSNGGQEPAAGVFIDGMYQPQLGFDIGFLDLQRLEVLRGPQGTLFGRNTEAGAINLVTRKPGDEFHARAEGEIAEHNTWRAFAAVSGPIAPGFSASLTAEHYDTDGYTKNPFNGQDATPMRRDSVRGVLRYNPNDNLDIVFSADRTKTKGNEAGLGAPLDCKCYDIFSDNDQVDTKETSGLQLNVDWKFGSGLTLTSITGYRKVESDIGIDFDGIPTGQAPATGNGVPGSHVAPGPITIAGLFQRIQLEQEFKSQEFRLAGATEKLDWLVGVYGFEQNQRQQRNFNIGPGTSHDPAIDFLFPTIIAEDFTTDRKGWAVFGQASWRPIERLELTAGVRYSDEDVDIGGERIRNILQIENANPTFFRLNDSEGFTDFSWMASIRYDLTETVKPYFTISKGWKAGGFTRFPSTPNAAVPYDSETSINYELGLKGTFFDRRLSANLALFHIDIDGQQLLTVTPDGNGIPVTTIANAGKAKSDGVEVELNWRATDRLKLGFSGSYTKAKYTDFDLCAAANFCISRDGHPFEFTPDLTAAATIEYRQPLAEDWNLDLYADYRYVASYLVPNGSFLANLGDQWKVPSYGRVNFRASISHDRFKLTGYVENLFDTYDYSNATPSAFFATDSSQVFVTPLAPRTFGAILSYQF
jgi:iron complex outermembrane receptor protein